MITITIEGPVGSGKSKIGHALYKTLADQKLRVMHKEEITDAALEKHSATIDVLIVEKKS